MLKDLEIDTQNPLQPGDGEVPDIRVRKGAMTRQAIIDVALEISLFDGPQAVTFGTLAEHLEMSKAGVFSHFGSMQGLQSALLDAYCRRFVERVLLPALPARRGLPRLEAIFANWVNHVIGHRGNGCLHIAQAAAQEDDSPILASLRAAMLVWRKTLEGAIRLAVRQGHLRQDADVRAIAYEMKALIFALHHDAWFMRDSRGKKRAEQAFGKVIEAYRLPAMRG